MQTSVQATFTEPEEFVVGKFHYQKNQHHWNIVCAGKKLGEVFPSPAHPNVFRCEILTRGQREVFEHIFMHVHIEDIDSENGWLVHDYPTSPEHFWKMATEVITKRILLIQHRLNPFDFNWQELVSVLVPVPVPVPVAIPVFLEQTNRADAQKKFFKKRLA